MQWYELTIRTTEEATDAIAAVLNEWGAGGVSIEESWLKHEGKATPLGEWYEVPKNDIAVGKAIIKAYFTLHQSIDQLRVQVKELLAQIESSGIDTSPAEMEIGRVDEQDWANAWKQYYHPVRVTEQLTVKPTWEAYEPAEGELIVELDPGMAFGTGTHATTTLCMKMLEKYIEPGNHVIDVGTGSGILAIASAKLGAERVLALDLDPVAVSSASENVKINQLERIIKVRQSDLLGVLQNENPEKPNEASIGVRIPTDIVVANILADIILRFVDDAYRILKPNGIFIASGIIDSKRCQVESEMKKQGFSIVEIVRDGEWVVIIGKKA